MKSALWNQLKVMNAPNINIGDVIVKIDPRYFRPAEVETLLGDPAKAKKKLRWTPQITVQEMCSEMVLEDLKPQKDMRYLKIMVITCLYQSKISIG